jgi:mitochondrial import receptor subunit TOM70
MDLDRDFIFSHIQLAVTQYKMGSTASAMATFKRTIKAFPKSPDAYNYFGELLMDSSKLQEAVEKFDTAIELENKSKPIAMNVLPLVNKALALFQMTQDFDEPINLCKKALISELCLHVPALGLGGALFPNLSQSIRNATLPSPPWRSSTSRRRT